MSFNGNSSINLNLSVNKIYKFNQTDSSNSSHPLYITNDSTSQETYQFITYGTPGNDNAYTLFSPNESGVEIYFYCPNHENMGSHYNPISIQE